MDGMKKAGLSPLEIIRSGTLNPAVFFGEENTFGEVKEGLVADLILLDANPLQDLNAIKSINGVMVRGSWLSKADIDKRLKEIAMHAANQ
jgi:imidazolonepropionase-like amidohydrolase